MSILYFDSDSRMRDIYTDFLRKKDYVVESVHDWVEANSKIGSFDLYIKGVNPLFFSKDFVERVYENGGRLILLSSLSETSTRNLVVDKRVPIVDVSDMSLLVQEINRQLSR